ncbi:MAG: glycosyltransferase family 4 protein [Steroidobacteraceae bacterium]
MPDKRITFVVNNAAFFVSHRLPLAKGALAAGFAVDLITGQAGSVSMERSAEAELVASGIPHHRVAFRSGGVNPLIELLGLLQLIGGVVRRSPDLVHCASPKGVLYGGLAARLCRVRALVLAVSGMGYAFTPAEKSGVFRAALRQAFRICARAAFGHPNVRVIVQNTDDLEAIVASGLATADKIVLIPGSGVRLTDFVAMPIHVKQQTVLFPARMLRDKGVDEFVRAARELKKIVPEWRFVLAGAADYQNPSSVTPEQIGRWQAEGVVEWLGHVEKVDALYAEASIVCLPSYREGMPKVLLEAAAAGCAVVTTDSIGCRDAIRPGVTGDLVPISDSQALADCLLRLINDKARRERYGQAGRQLAIDRFGVESVVEKTLGIYRVLLENG